MTRLLALVVICFGLLFSLVVVGLRLFVLVGCLWVWAVDVASGWVFAADLLIVCVFWVVGFGCLF